MHDQDEIKAILSEDPENFQALYELAVQFYKAGSHSAAFAMADRAIESYEKHGDPSNAEAYFAIKRLHGREKRDHLDELVGPAVDMLDSRWSPVFKQGRPHELALSIEPSKAHLLPIAMSAPQLKRLRYLNVVFRGDCSHAAEVLVRSKFDTLRTLGLSFESQPPSVPSLFEAMGRQLRSLLCFKLRLPALDDEVAISVRSALGVLEALSFKSQERLMTSRICRYLADDPRSRSIMRLGLVGTCIGDEGLFDIFSSDNFTMLQVLDVHDGTLTNNGARVLAAHELPNLRAVDVRFNQIDPAGIHILSGVNLQIAADNQHEFSETQF